MKTLLSFLLATTFLHATQPIEVFNLDQSTSVQHSFNAEELHFPHPVLQVKQHKSTYVTMGLALVPGLGHTYLGEWKTAAGLFGTTCGAIGATGIEGTSDSFKLNSLVTAQNTWSYGIYAAYRDVRAYNGQLGYQYKMPTDTIANLTSAPFRTSVLKKPEVWGGFLGAMALGVGVSYLAFPHDAAIRTNLSSGMQIYPISALPVGVGEEAFFRGFLQSGLSEYFTPWGGIALSSLAFGAMHAPNAMALAPEHRWRYYTFSLPLITTLGAYFGWMTQKNNSLQPSVALHTWYDFVLFAANALATRASIISRADFQFSTDF